MIAADTSSLVAYLAGESGPDVRLIDEALEAKVLHLPPVVLTEVLSEPALTAPVRSTLLALPLLEALPGYWERAGGARLKLLARKFKARVADALIAQSCIDHNVGLISRDNDFRHYAQICGLKIMR